MSDIQDMWDEYELAHDMLDGLGIVRNVPDTEPIGGGFTYGLQVRIGVALAAERKRGDDAEREVAACHEIMRQVRVLCGNEHGLTVATVEAALAAATSRADAAEARARRLAVELERLKRGCYRHLGGDNACECSEIDAALADAAAGEP